MARPSSYTPEFREEAVQLALKSAPRPIAQTARELDVHPETAPQLGPGVQTQARERRRGVLR
ncbi:transposase [Embleya sp. NPDC059237]|uniref:transposase n=1 Tax=Embleya sp. NPDC059237 TaxID=3346784 RepID=UPI0036A97CF7